MATRWESAWRIFAPGGCVDQIDFRSLTINCLTSGRMACAKVPLAFDTDRQMIEAALSTVGLTEPPREPDLVDPQHARTVGNGMLGGAARRDAEARRRRSDFGLARLSVRSEMAICRPRAFMPASSDRHARAQRKAEAARRSATSSRAVRGLLLRPRGDGTRSACSVCADG